MATIDGIISPVITGSGPLFQFFIMKNKLKVGDTCTVQIDWGSGNHKGKRVQISRLQKNGDQLFAKVFWKGKSASELAKEYGILFNVSELKKVE